jgi:deoxyguanosine kinase
LSFAEDAKQMYAIEGLIGVGKSTVLQELYARGFVVQTEAVDAWTLLPHMAADPARYGALFQLQVLVSYAARVHGVEFMERSADSALHVFAAKLAAESFISEAQLQMLRDVYAMLPHPPPERYIYLRADPELCMRRIAERSRNGEGGVTLQYLQALDEAYSAFFAERNVAVIDVLESDTPADIADKIMHASISA